MLHPNLNIIERQIFSISANGNIAEVFKVTGNNDNLFSNSILTGLDILDYETCKKIESTELIDFAEGLNPFSELNTCLVVFVNDELYNFQHFLRFCAKHFMTLQFLDPTSGGKFYISKTNIGTIGHSNINKNLLENATKVIPSL